MEKLRLQTLSNVWNQGIIKLRRKNTGGMGMKKILVSLLVVMCIAALVLLPASAAETSGSCGENVTWELEDGILTVSGSGEMTSNPWADQKSKIKEVFIEDGVTSVCASAFEGHSNLEYVTLAASVAFIGDRAFYSEDNNFVIYFKGDAPEFGEDWYHQKRYAIFLSYDEENGTWDAIEDKNWYGVDLGPSCFDTSGSCGEDLTYSIKNNVLTISGSGAMEEYDVQNMPPWKVYCREITKVVVKDGVTTISHKAFIEFGHMTEADIPESVKEIGGQAFKDCTSLKSISLPGVEYIGDFNFQNCTSLKKVEFSEALDTIEMYAFEGCTSLTSVTIPAGAKYIHMGVFQGCTSLEEIWFCGDSPQWMDMIFTGVTATAYYPEGNETWTEEKMSRTEGDITWVSYVPEECSHVEVKDKGKAATCTEDGLTEGSHCDECGEVLMKQEKIPATGHSFGDWKTVKEPTTEKTGKAERKCSDCGKVEGKTLEKLDAPEPTETKPAETEPAETTPTETEPAQTQPTETGPVETQPAETEPTETEPTQTQPAETEPSQTQPADSQPATDDAPEQTQPQTEEPADEPAGTPWGIIAAVAVIVLGGGAAAVVLIKKHKK